MLKQLLIICLLIGMVSCTKEIVIYNHMDNDEDATYTEGYLAVHLENMGIATRSVWEDENYDAYFPSSDILHEDTKHERGFYNRLLVSFDSNFLLEYYTQPNSGVNDSFIPPSIDNLTSVNSEYTGVPLGLDAKTPLTTGAHYFYVLCNLPETMHGEIRQRLSVSQGVLTKDQFELTVLDYPLETLAQKFDGWTDPKEKHYTQRCMMTNIVSPAPDYMASKDQKFEGLGYPSTNNVKAYIGKIFAKASLAYVEENGKLSNIKYRVVNVPKKVYLLPNIFDEQVEAPHYDVDFLNNYNTRYNEWFDEKYKLETNDPDWQEAILTTNQEKTYVYCMENGNKTPLQGNSTFLLVQGKFTPNNNEWLDENGDPGSPRADGTFWRIKRNGYYTPGYYNSEPVTSSQVDKYEYGITYYPIWLQTYGKYQVKRNGFYKIVIEEVRSAGAPTPESVIDSLEPLENPETRSSFTKSGDANSPEITTSIKWQQGF